MRSTAHGPLPEDLLTTYKRYERGRHFPTHYAPLLAAVFGTDADSLFGSRHPTRPPVEPPSRTAPIALNNGDWSTDQSVELAELVREGVELSVTAETVARLVHEWLVVEPPQLVELHAGRRIGDALMSKVERRIAELRRIDDFMAGGDLHRLVEQELHATATLLRYGSYTEALGRRLLVAIGELCQLAGWVFSDAGLHERAAHVYLAGIKAGHAADDRGLAGNLVSTLSYQVANVGDPREATLLAQSAVAGTRGGTPAVQALFNERLAWAYAKSGDRRSTERTLAAVEKAFDKSVPETEPEWVYWLDEDEISIMAGRCYVELGSPERAVPLLSSVLDHYDEHRTRELALYTSWLAEAHIQHGAIEAAADAATKALTLTSRTTSARSNDRITELRHQLRPYLTVPAVADFEDMARELSGKC